jgi:putative chitinase
VDQGAGVNQSHKEIIMDRKAFFTAIRPMFGGSLSQSQVDGLNRLLDVWHKYYAINGSAEELAYNLATSFHETAATMQPITERGSRSYFNKYEPGTRIGKRLGNTQKGDGYRFRGEGDVQNTGRANARKATKRLNEVFGLGIDLEVNPDQRGDPFISAHSLFLGNREGWWTGRDLGGYIDGVDESDAEDRAEYVKARAVVNGKDRADLIAGYAVKFEAALKAADYGKKAHIPEKVERLVEDADKPGASSTTNIATGIGAASSTIAIAKEATDAAKDSVDSVSAILAAGPWVLLLLVALGAGWWIWRERQRKAKAAQAAKAVM